MDIWERKADELVQKKHTWKSRVEHLVGLLVEKGSSYPGKKHFKVVEKEKKEKDSVVFVDGDGLAEDILEERRFSVSALRSLVDRKKNEKGAETRFSNTVSFFYFVSLWSRTGVGSKKRSHMTLAEFESFLRDKKVEAGHFLAMYVNGLVLLKEKLKLSRVSDVCDHVVALTRSYGVLLAPNVEELAKQMRKEETQQTQASTDLEAKGLAAKELAHKLVGMYDKLDLEPRDFVRFACDVLRGDKLKRTSKDVLVPIFVPSSGNVDEARVFETVLLAKAVHTLLFQCAVRTGQLTKVPLSAFQFGYGDSVFGAADQGLRLQFRYEDRKSSSNEGFACIKLRRNPKHCALLTLAEMIVFSAKRSEWIVYSPSMGVDEQELRSRLSSFLPFLDFKNGRDLGTASVLTTHSKAAKVYCAMHTLLKVGCGVMGVFESKSDPNLHLFRSLVSEVLVASGMSGPEVDMFVGWAGGGSTRNRSYQAKRSEVARSSAVNVLASVELGGQNRGVNGNEVVEDLLQSMPEHVIQDAYDRLLPWLKNTSFSHEVTGVFHTLYMCARLCYISLALKPKCWLARHFGLSESDTFLAFSRSASSAMVRAEQASQGESVQSLKRKLIKAEIEMDELRKTVARLTGEVKRLRGDERRDSIVSCGSSSSQSSSASVSSSSSNSCSSPASSPGPGLELFSDSDWREDPLGRLGVLRECMDANQSLQEYFLRVDSLVFQEGGVLDCLKQLRLSLSGDSRQALGFDSSTTLGKALTFHLRSASLFVLFRRHIDGQEKAIESLVQEAEKVQVKLRLRSNAEVGRRMFEAVRNTSGIVDTPFQPSELPVGLGALVKLLMEECKVKRIECS